MPPTFFRASLRVGDRDHTAASSSGTGILLLAILLLGLVLRTYKLGEKTIWLDEAFSIWVSSFPLPEMLGWIARIDQHPPLYYILLSFWMRVLGDSATAVRSLSAVLGFLALPFFYGAARRFLGVRPALIAASILAISPFNIRYSQEARMYSLLVLGAAAALYFLSRLLMDEPGEETGWGSWTGYAVSQSAVMLTHNIGLVFFPIIMNTMVLTALAFRRSGYVKGCFPGLAADRFLLKWLLCQAASLLIWLPWLGPFVHQALRIQGDFWIPSPSWSLIYSTFQDFNFACLPSSMPLPWLWNALYWLLAALGIVALRKRPALVGLLVLLFLGPVVGELLASLVRPIFLKRTLITVTLPYYMLMAVGISTIGDPSSLRGKEPQGPGDQRAGRLLRVAAIGVLTAVVAGLSCVALSSYTREPQKEDWAGAAEFVARKIRPDDLIVFNASWAQIPFEYYFRDFQKPNLRKGLPVDLFAGGVLEPKMTLADVPQMLELLQNRKRVFLVYSHAWFTDPERIITRVLDLMMAREDYAGMPGVEIFVYDRRPQRQ